MDKTLKYQIAIWWSEDDQAFLAMAPELPRCIADGETPEAALCELRHAMSCWLDNARAQGWPIPQPSGRLLPVQDEFDWKRSRPQVQNDSPSSRCVPSSRARLKSKLTPVAQSKKRSTHVTTKNTV